MAATRRETGATDSAVGRWDDARPHYQSFWQQRHGASGKRFEDVEPGYRFAHEMRGKPEFAERQFDHAEADLRKSWETTYKDRPWTDAREHVREGWDRTLALREEQLVVNKERVQTGQVEIGKRVVEEQKTMDVPVTREEVVIERRPVNQPSDAPIGEDARTIQVPVMGERVDVEKRTIVTEEVGVQRRVEQDTVPVDGTVRREEAVINRTGETNTAGQDWSNYQPTFRQHWQTNYGSTGDWAKYEPMYRYGFDQRSSGRWGGRAWSDVEPELRRDWSSRHPETSWDVASNPIKHAWDHLTSTAHTHR